MWRFPLRRVWISGLQAVNDPAPDTWVLLLNLRHFSVEASSEDGGLLYNRALANHKTQMKELRKEYMELVQQKALEDAERRRVEMEERAEIAKAKRLMFASAKAQRLEEKARERKTLLETLGARREESARRETIRRRLIDGAREERRKKLLEESRKWISRETLDVRIQQALDDPINLL